MKEETTAQHRTNFINKYSEFLTEDIQKQLDKSLTIKHILTMKDRQLEYIEKGMLQNYLYMSDQFAMINSVESRSPFLDYRLAKYINMSDVTTKVKAIIIDKLGVDESEVTGDANFTNDLGADSLDTVELIMELEKEFDIQIPDDEAEGIATVGDAISFVEGAI